MSSSYFLCGDVGGTNSRLQMFELQADGVSRQMAKKIFPSRNYSHLTVVISEFLAEVKLPVPPLAACIAVAGPVKNNRCHVTNLNWNLDGVELSHALHIPKFLLINDFVAIGYGLLALKDSDKVLLNAKHNPQVVPHAPIACLGAGTGLGEVYLTHNGKNYDVWPSEGGHADFAPRNKLEFDLMNFMRERERVERVSVERVVSGLGLPRIYEFLASRSPSLISNKIESEMRMGDMSAVITKYGLSKEDVLCEQALELFVAAYGSEAGNLALKTLCFGGLYIAGGIAPKILPALQDHNMFYSNLQAKGRMKSLLSSIPVYVVLHSQVGLLGAQVMCLRLMEDSGCKVTGGAIYETEHEPVSPRKSFDNTSKVSLQQALQLPIGAVTLAASAASGSIPAAASVEQVATATSEVASAPVVAASSSSSPVFAMNSLCEECAVRPVSRHCKDCQVSYCDRCSALFHLRGTRAHHIIANVKPCSIASSQKSTPAASTPWGFYALTTLNVMALSFLIYMNKKSTPKP